MFLYDTQILDKLEDRDDRRVSFIHRSLRELDEGLRLRGSRLITLHGDPTEEIPRLARALGADSVFVGADYEPYAIERDSRVSLALAEMGATFCVTKDHVIFESDEIRSQSGGIFKVYTPYMRAWRAAFEDRDAAERTLLWDRLWPAPELPGFKFLELDQLGFVPNETWLAAGEQAGRERLSRFVDKLPAYGEERDFPALDATSGLSVHLRFGTISIREAVRMALEHPSEGATKWLNELIWREFYQMILAEFPHVVDRAFKPEFDSIVWPGSEDHFAAWCEGQTGYPIVDAAMRCLNATGWMHNRLRMVCASFLTKDLLVDWRKGERYFARRLLDYDLSQNNGGWQWSASTGVDAQPHFRIFNPTLQSRKFDPSGDFIRQWCPELAKFSDDALHWPHDAPLFEQLALGCEFGKDYPNPIVKHDEQRIIAIQLLSAAAKSKDGS